MNRSAAGLVVLVVVALCPATSVDARDKTRECGQVTTNLPHGGEGQAHHILATRVSCHRARKVARLCLRDRLGDGWDVFAGAEKRLWGPRYTLERVPGGGPRVSFYIAGGGGCYRP